MWRLLNHQIKANIIFKVSRFSVAELVNTFAQLLRAEGLVSSSIQEYPVPSLLTRIKTLRIWTLEGKKKSCLFWSKKRILNLSFTSLGKEEISFIYEILLILLSYEYFWMILRFIVYNYESLLFLGNGKHRAVALKLRKYHSSGTGVGGMPHRTGSEHCPVRSKD